MDFKKSVSNEKANETTYISKAAIRKEMRIKRMAREGIRAWVVELRSQKALLPRALIEFFWMQPVLPLETIESMRKHATYQRRMLDQAVQLVRRVEFLCIHASSYS
ncbi:hypothetical protein ACFX2F_046052 [Malus domestica]